MSTISSKFTLRRVDFGNGLKRAFILDHYLTAGQSALRLEAGRPFIIINPPTSKGHYRLSVRELRDGRRLIIVGDLIND